MTYSFFVRSAAVLSWAAVGWSTHVCFAQPDPAYYRMEIQREQTKQIRALLQADVIRLAEERRQLAIDEIDDVKDEIAQLKARVQSKSWALAYFEDTRSRFLPVLDNAPSSLQNYARIRDVFREKFLKFPELSKGEIRSGKALNFFLDACGETAVEHQMLLKRMEAEAKQAALSPGGSTPSAEDVARRELLEQLGNASRFDRDDLRSIRVTVGLLGPKETIRLNDEPLPLEWPTAIRHADDRYGVYIRRVELVKKQCIDALAVAPKNAKTGMGIPVDLQLNLMQSVDQLCAAFQNDTERMIAPSRDPNLIPTRILSPSDRVQRVAAMRYLQELRNGVTRFIEARRAHDVESYTFPEDEKQPAGIADVICFMTRHGYRFAEADINDELVYKRLYDAMRDYYTDLYGLKFSSEAEYRQIALSEERLMKLNDIKLEPITFEAVSANEVLVEAARAVQALANAGS